jgi:CheY-like chemotaxis protein
MMPETTSLELRYHHVMVVEDDRALLELLTEYMELQGLEVTAVETGEAALAALEGEHPPDAVLLDIRIPGISGDEVLRRMKSSPRLARIPVAAMTGMHPGEFHLIARPDAFLAKPFDMDTLGAALSAMARRSG